VTLPEGRPPAKPSRSGIRRYAGGALAVAVIVVVFALLLPRIADYAEVIDVIRGLSLEAIAALTVAAIVNVATFGPPWMAALPGLTYRQSMVLTQTSTALSSAVPGGDAVGIGVSYGMLRQWGFEPHPVAVAVLLTGLWNQMLNVLLPLLALALLLLEGERQPLLTTAGLIGLAAVVAVGVGLGMVLRGERQAAAVGARAERLANPVLRLVRRPPLHNLPETFVHFRRETIEVLARRWHWITIAQLVGHLTVFAVLLVALRVTGVSQDEVDWVEALAAWGLIRLLTAIPITPGGLGVVELGLSGALVGFGADNAEVVASVLLYRALTYVPPIILGALLGLTWRRHRVPDTT
jgi:uncharacterized membrane protein YbhN (UPF0104 family)